MKWTQIAADVFGLNNEELRLMQGLESGRKTVSALARIAGLPRTTVSFMLKKIEKRGIVRRVSVNKHFEWEAVSAEELENHISTIFAEATRAVGEPSVYEPRVIEGVISKSALRAFENQTSEEIQMQIDKLGTVYVISDECAETVVQTGRKIDLKSYLKGLLSLRRGGNVL